MSGTVARVTEISATSDTSFEDAVKVGLARAHETLRGVRSAWVKEQSVDVENGQVAAYRVNLTGHVRPRVERSPSRTSCPALAMTAPV
ncbi:MAG TPA: dodecin family protein [Mycobacterium sp.]|jgi:hypothetical protein